jgi:hypothetical protein
MLDRSRSTCRFFGEARAHQHSLQWAIELRSMGRKIMTSQLESLIQQANQLERLAVCLDAHNSEETFESMRRCDSNRDERIELITHLANSLHSSNDSTSEPVLTEIQQSQLDRLRSEIEIGLEQVKVGEC